MTNKAAIVGAGLAGLSCARALRRAGFFVDVFEQDRVIGGRIATIRIGEDVFDHGAQYLTARAQEFGSYLKEIAGLGYADRWAPRTAPNGSGAEADGQMHPWIVGTPGMSSLVRPLTERVRVSTGKRVDALERREAGWHVHFANETSAGPFDTVVVAAPAEQARGLLGHVPEFVAPLGRVRMAPCWTLMVRVEEKVLPEQDIYSDVSKIIAWVARNNAKPGRNSAGENIVVHASTQWSREAENADTDSVAEELWSEVSNCLSLPPVRPSRMTAHLWRHAHVDRPLGQPYLYSAEHKVGVAGDWCHGRLAEHAFESGSRLGRAIANALA